MRKKVCITVAIAAEVDSTVNLDDLFLNMKLVDISTFSLDKQGKPVKLENVELHEYETVNVEEIDR